MKIDKQLKLTRTQINISFISKNLGQNEHQIQTKTYEPEPKIYTTLKSNPPKKWTKIDTTNSNSNRRT